MGVVKVDIYKKDLEWRGVSLSDPESVKGLLKLRTRFDLLYTLDTRNTVDSTFADLNNQIDEITCIYVMLDELMKEIRFSSRQISILDRYVEGYSVEEIAIEDKQSVRNINGILNTICKSISNEAERQWRKWAYTQKLNLRTKKCSKCEEDLPATDEFFTTDYTKSDGYKSICKKCR